MKMTVVFYVCMTLVACGGLTIGFAIGMALWGG